MKLIINKDRSVIPVGTWGTVNENDYEILDFEFPAELDEYNKRIVYYLDDERVWDTIVDNKVTLTNAITTKGTVKAYIWLTKTDPQYETDVDFRTQLFEMNFYENENADGIVPTPEQVDGFNTMLTAMNNKIDEVDALEQTIETAEAERQEAEATRVSNENTRESNESTRQTNEQTRQAQEADRERRTDEAIGNIEDKTAEYNANAEAKTTAFNNNATQKTNEFNSNYTQKVNDFNTNASSKELAFNSNASSKTNDFNSNAETKTNAFNTNATNKTNAFNDNATEKTTTFNNNASTKTSEFNTNAESKTSAFNDNSTQKTTNFNNNASEKTDEFNTNAQNKIDEYDEHIVEYQAQIDELQEEVDELSENMPWNTTEQATEISVDDAAKYSKNKLELFGNTSQDSYQGYNLVDVSPYQEETKNGVTLTKDSDGNIILNGTSTSAFGWNVSLPETRVLPAGTYTKSITKDSNIGTYLTVSIGYNGASINGTSIQPSRGIYSMPLEQDTSFDQIRMYISNGTTFNNYKLNYMILSGEYTAQTIPNYEPYVGGVPSPNPDYPQPIHVVTGNNTIHVNNTDYPVNIGNIELCKIGNYQDYLYKENGNWYEHMAIRHNIATGASTEQWTWTLRNENKAVVQSTKIGACIDGRSFVAIFSNNFKGTTGDIVFATGNNHTNVIGCAENNRIRIAVSPNDFANIDDFKNFLQENNLDFYFVLDTPIITQITDETLISQLDAIYEHLQLAKGTNNITVTAEDLAPYMQLSYMQDLKSKLDNLDSRLSLLE